MYWYEWEFFDGDIGKVLPYGVDVSIITAFIIAIVTAAIAVIVSTTIIIAVVTAITRFILCSLEVFFPDIN